MFAAARQAEIIRSNQKDQYYIGYIKGALAESVQLLVGSRRWIQWRKEVDLIADIAYFGLTTLKGYQTLGEEYVNIVQVDDTKRALPSSWRRAAMILLQVAAPYVINRCLDRLEHQLRHNSALHLDADARARLLHAISVIKNVVTIAHRCHLAVFYMKGLFYHISKRLTGAQYILVRSTRGDNDASSSNYGILGWLSVLQLSFTFAQQWYKWSQQRPGALAVGLGSPSPMKLTSDAVARPQTDGAVTARSKCSLCLEPRLRSTATPCGHLFCYSCITEWGSSKGDCPLCRERFHMSRLACLQNYDPS